MSRLVSVERPKYGVAVVKKSRGKLTIEDIMEGLRGNSEDEECRFALFLRPAGGHECVPGDDPDAPMPAVLHNLDLLDSCPACGASYEDMRNQFHDATYRAGYEAGLEAARSGKE